MTMIEWLDDGHMRRYQRRDNLQLHDPVRPSSAMALRSSGVAALRPASSKPPEPDGYWRLPATDPTPRHRFLLPATTHGAGIVGNDKFRCLCPGGNISPRWRPLRR